MFPGRETSISDLAWSLGLLRAARLLNPSWVRKAVFDAGDCADVKVRLWVDGMRQAAGAWSDDLVQATGRQGPLEAWEWVDFAVALVDEITLLKQWDPSQSTPLPLVEAALKRFLRRPAGAVVAGGVKDQWYQQLLVATLRAGIKPAGLYETLASSSAAACEALAREQGLALRRFEAKQGQTVVLLAPEEAGVERLHRAFEEAEHSDARPDERNDARLEIGRLLGYPTCCSTRYCTELSRNPQLTNAWLEMERRLEFRGAVAPVMNPAVDLWPLKAIPCSLECSEATRVGHAIDRLASQAIPKASLARLRQAASNPWLMSLETDGAGVELLVDGEPDGRFTYAVGLVASSIEEDADPVIRVLKAGNVLEIGPAGTKVWKRNRLLADLTGRAYIWWAKRPVQCELLLAVLEARRNLEAPPMGNATPAQGRLSAGEASAPWVASLRTLLEQAGTTARSMGVFVSDCRHVPGAGELELSLSSSSPECQVVLRAKPQSNGRSYLVVGKWEFSHLKEQPVDTQAKRDLVNRFRRALESAINPCDR